MWFYKISHLNITDILGTQYRKRVKVNLRTTPLPYSLNRDVYSSLLLEKLILKLDAILYRGCKGHLPSSLDLFVDIGRVEKNILPDYETCSSFHLLVFLWSVRTFFDVESYFENFQLSNIMQVVDNWKYRFIDLRNLKIFESLQIVENYKWGKLDRILWQLKFHNTSNQYHHNVIISILEALASYIDSSIWVCERHTLPYFYHWFHCVCKVFYSNLLSALRLLSWIEPNFTQTVRDVLWIC